MRRQRESEYRLKSRGFAYRRIKVHDDDLDKLRQYAKRLEHRRTTLEKRA